MDRGGVYLMGSFLAGNIAASLLEHFSNVHIPQPLLLFQIFLLGTLFTTLHIIIPRTIITSRTCLRFGSAIKNAKATYMLCCLIFFLCGATNMQRGSRIQFFPKSLRCSFENMSQDIKVKFSAKLGELIPDKSDRAVVTAFTIGDKSGIPHHIKEAYRDTGAAHTLALSGLHTGIIYGIIDLLLFFLNFNYKSRRIKLLISATAILMYACITGFSPSVQRAAIMIIIWKSLAISSRRAARWSAWLISACIILLINPLELHDVGFQLSFAAVAGIIAIYPAINRAWELLANFRYSKIIKPVWNLAGISVACQIATLPLVLFYFNTSPTYFLIANMAAIPLVTCTLYALAAAAVTQYIPIIGGLCAFALQKCIALLNFIITHIETV